MQRFFLTVALCAAISATALSAEPPAASATSAVSVAAPAAPAKPVAGHSMHGESFNEGPRGRAMLMPGMPRVEMKVTTKNEEAQKFFNQGLGQLHGFWYYEAERSFRQVAMLDPDCAMAYWGMAMANANNVARAKGFIAEAEKKKSKAGPREVAWIEALSRYHAAPDNADRRQRMIRDLEDLIHSAPDDVEAKAFLALQIYDNSGWKKDKQKPLPISGHESVDALLAQIFALAPDHPAHHYRIHLWDERKPERALAAAAACGPSSPGIAHMWHMPGHTYSRLHRYADAAWQQEASARVDHAQMIRDGIMPYQIHNYAHNNEWLTRDLTHVGRVRDAVDLARNMIELPRHPKLNNAELGGSAAKFGTERLEEVLAVYERWDEIAALSDQKALSPTKSLEEKAERAVLLIRAFAAAKRADDLKAQLASLDPLLGEARTARYAAADEAEKKAKAEKKPDEEIAKAMTAALRSKSDEVSKIEKLLNAGKAFAALQAGDKAAAKSSLDLAEGAPRVRGDHMALAFLAAGDLAKAETLARDFAVKHPDEVYPLATLVEALAANNKTDEAKTTFEKLRTLAARLDEDTAVYKRSTALAAAWGIADDWRIVPSPPADLGARPDLASLGPFRWSPSPAPQWTSVGPDGAPISSTDFAGKPVIVVFYLGAGCLHCVEQLQAFAPLTEEFEKAGIKLVAISTDKIEGLKDSLRNFGEGSSRFTFASDPDLNVFKAFQAHDDFEHSPLHGTFLIDAAGMVRWRDVSHEPFREVKFLLEESKRLLKTRTFETADVAR